MKNINLFLSVFVLLSMLAIGCKDGNSDSTQTGLVLDFEHVVGNTDLVYGEPHTIESGETVTFTKVKYYVSNIAFEREDGSWYTIPQDKSYFLVDHATPSSQKINFPDMPVGNYRKVRFLLGVDSARSVAPISQRTGVLDESAAGADMYWSWNSGYIFIKMEGTYGAEPFQYHIGGFGGYSTQTVNNLKTFTLAFPGDLARVQDGREAPEVHIKLDALEFFKTPTTIVVADNPTEHFSSASVIFANNYTDMFSVDHVHNP